MVLLSKFVALIVAVCPFGTTILSKFNNVIEDKSIVPTNSKVSIPAPASKVSIPVVLLKVKVSVFAPVIIFSIFVILLVFPFIRTVFVPSIVTVAVFASSAEKFIESICDEPVKCSIFSNTSLPSPDTVPFPIVELNVIPITSVVVA